MEGALDSPDPLLSFLLLPSRPALQLKSWRGSGDARLVRPDTRRSPTATDRLYCTVDCSDRLTAVRVVPRVPSIPADVRTN